MGFPGGSDSKESACRPGYPGLIPGSGRSPGEGNVKPLQYSCLENPIDGGAWQATAHGVPKSQTRLSNFTHYIPMQRQIYTRTGNMYTGVVGWEDPWEK